MNAIARDLSRAAHVSSAMARDLLGYAAVPPSAITFNTVRLALDTGADVGVVDSTWKAGTRIPAHLHHGEDEILIVLSGDIEIRLGERVLRRGSGGTAFIPRGVSHEVRALGEARVLAILTRRSLEGPRCL